MRNIQEIDGRGRVTVEKPDFYGTLSGFELGDDGPLPRVASRTLGYGIEPLQGSNEWY